MKPPNPLDRLILARKHSVEEWTLPALLGLCERPKPLSLEEARLMDFEDVVLVGSVRQTVRSSILMVDGTGIRNCIRVWKVEEQSSSVPDIPNSTVQFHLPQKLLTRAPTPNSPIPPPESVEPPVTEPAVIRSDPALAISRKSSKAASKAASKAESKAESKAASKAASKARAASKVATETTWGGLGSVPSVTGSTSGGGWGAATGNHNGTNSLDHAWGRV